MSLTLIALLGVVLLLVLLFLGMNIGASMLLVGFVGFAYVVNLKSAIGLLQTVVYTSAASYTLSVVPMFVLMGEFAYVSGLTTGLFGAANRWLDRVPGSLACASLAGCAAFGAICGSPGATAATMGVVALPEMKRYGYSDDIATGCIAMGGTLGIIIPPSTSFILYGVSANESIGELFAAGIIPGIILTVLCMFVVIFQVKRHPEKAPSAGRYTLREKFESLKGIWGVVVLFLIVIGGIFLGWFTPNEGAAIGCLLAFGYMVITKTCTWNNVITSIIKTARTVGMVFFIVIGATIFGNFLSITKLPMNLADFVASLEVSRYVVLAGVCLILTFLGCVMDALPIILLTTPVFLPIIVAEGFDPIWYGVIMTLMMQMGLISPPVGMNCYIIAGLAKGVPLSTIFRGAVPYIIVILITVILVTVVPGLATWLPELMYAV